jgi:hypothetical protein
MPGPDARRVIRAADELHPTHFHDHPRQPFADARRFERKPTIRREKVYWRKLKRDKGEAPSERGLPRFTRCDVTSIKSFESVTVRTAMQQNTGWKPMLHWVSGLLSVSRG